MALRKPSGIPAGSGTSAPRSRRRASGASNRPTTNAWVKDLATDIAFYDQDIIWDRNSNITLTEDNAFSGFDASYTMDELDRLVDAQEGTWSGSTITSETREQEWTLSHTGNWDLGKLDLNGDGDWSDADEYEDSRTHNAVNELTARDVDNDSTDDFTLVYDEAGNLIDDGENYKYVYDPFGRLRKVKNQSDTVVAEYVYNGLGFQIGRLEDTDDDGDADASDTWFHTAFDEAWRYLSTFRADDSSPKDEVVPHLAGPGGYGGSSYINSVILRDRDGTQANWLAASDGTMEFRFYYCQNWRGDVVALISAAGKQIEFVRYTSYGIPIGFPGADTDTDGDCDQTDIDQIQSWISSGYDWRGDVDLDGDVDASDKSDAQNWLQGKTHGWEVLGSEGNRMAYAGESLQATSGDLLASDRARSTKLTFGRWIARDPIGYQDGASLYQQVLSNPLRFTDPYGTKSSSQGDLKSCDNKKGINGWPKADKDAPQGCKNQLHLCYDCLLRNPFQCRSIIKALDDLCGDWTVKFKKHPSGEAGGTFPATENDPSGEKLNSNDKVVPGGTIIIDPDHPKVVQGIPVFWHEILHAAAASIMLGSVSGSMSLRDFSSTHEGMIHDLDGTIKRRKQQRRIFNNCPCKKECNLGECYKKL